MKIDGYKNAFYGLLETYVALSESAEPIVRQLKKTRPGTRCKLTRELRNLDKKRLALLDEMDDLAST